MAFPYSSGEVLTAANLNASSGLVLIKTQTIGTSVSSVTVSSAFSSTFDNYRILVSGGAVSTNATLRLQMSGSTTASEYFSMRTGVSWSGTTNTDSRNGTSAYFDFVGRGSTTSLQMSVELQSPYLSEQTFACGASIGGGYGWFGAALLDNTTSHTGFVLNCDSGTMTGGTIRVYGYNNG